jgi:hypothetical protein
VKWLPRNFALCTLALCISACSKPESPSIEGRPDGPYRMTFETDPVVPQSGQMTVLTSRLTHRSNDKPVSDLQVLHERVIHNFIVKLDFSSFAHIHHEDFDRLNDGDLERAELRFPYLFPTDGSYRIVSEFTHRDRSWTKHFDLQIGSALTTPALNIDLAREKTFGLYRTKLTVSPAVPVAGFETELVLELARGSQPVTDLELFLGSEVHVALWRIDGKHFGHTHTYTHHMAAMMAAIYDRATEPTARAELMTKMMDTPVELIFRGPKIPVHYVFSEPGTYAIFFQSAPGGEPQIFDFMLEVSQYREGMDTRIDSMSQ